MAGMLRLDDGNMPEDLSLFHSQVRLMLCLMIKDFGERTQ